MQQNTFRKAMSLALVLAAVVLIGGNGEYKGGNAESVKKWISKNYDQVQNGSLPLCIYIYDPDIKKNFWAERLEGADVLANAKVKDALKPFQTVKVKTDGQDAPKGWPNEWTRQASNGAVIVLASSDLKYTVFIGRNTPKEQITSDFIIQNAKIVLKYEEKLQQFLAAKKAEAEKSEKKVAAAEVDEKKPLLPGLGEKAKEAKDAKKPVKVAMPVDE